MRNPATGASEKNCATQADNKIRHKKIHIIFIKRTTNYAQNRL